MNKIAANTNIPSGSFGNTRTNAIENAKKLREERKNNLAMTGEMALTGNRDSASLTRNFGTNQSRGQPRSSCDTRVSKPLMKISSGADNQSGNQDYGYQNANIMNKSPMLEMNQSNNTIYKKPFKGGREQDIDQATKTLNEELITLDKNLNQKANILKNLGPDENGSYLDKMSRGPGIRKAPIAATKSFATNELDRKPTNEEDELYNTNFPSRIPKNQWNREKNPTGLSMNSSNNFNSLNSTGGSTNKRDEYGNPDLMNNNNFGNINNFSNSNNYANNNYNTNNNNYGNNNYTNNLINTQSFKPTVVKENYFGNEYSKTIDFSNNKDTTDTKIFTKPNFKKAKDQPLQPQPQTQPQQQQQQQQQHQQQHQQHQQHQQQPQEEKRKVQQEPVTKTTTTNNKVKHPLVVDSTKDEDEEELILCPEGCGRKFKPKALMKHAAVCKKIFGTKKKDTEAKENAAKAVNTKGKPQPASKNPMNETKGKWKLDSENLRAQIKAAKTKK